MIFDTDDKFLNIDFKDKTKLSLNVAHNAKQDITLLVHKDAVLCFIDYDSFNENIDKVTMYIPKNSMSVSSLTNYKSKVWKRNKHYKKLDFNKKAIVDHYKSKFIKS